MDSRYEEIDIVKLDHCKQTLLVALLLATGLAGCGAQEDAEEDGPPGQAAFGRFCAGCHGMQGQGRLPNFPPLAGSEWLELPPEALTAIVLLGLRGEIEVAGRTYSGYMPPMQHIDDSRVAEIVTFIQREWSDNSDDWTTEDVASVRNALAGRGSPMGRRELERMMEELP